MNENMMKLEELLKDPAMAEQLLSIDNPEEVQGWLSEHGVEMSLDDIKAMRDVIEKIASGEISQEQLEKAASGELSADELQEVAGGLGFTGSLIAFVVICAVEMFIMEKVNDSQRRR